MTSKSITHTDLHKLNNKLVSALLEHFWCMDKPWANMDSQNSPWPGFGGSHHLPPYSILCAWQRDLHPNVILFRDSRVGISKFPKLGLSQLKAHNFVCRPPIEMRFEAKLYPSSIAFQRYVTCHLHIRKSGQFSIFNGRESNWQFAS
jgi:hypothetical protein